MTRLSAILDAVESSPRLVEGPAGRRGARLLDEHDVPWIAKLLDLVERCVGQPWRVLAERVEHAPLGISVAQRAAMLTALRRLTGGRAERVKLARRVRAITLGTPVLDPAARATRIGVAADYLRLPPAEIETLLWVDLAMERPVTLPAGRPAELDLAAYANLDRITRWVRRAHTLELRLWDDANALVREIARSGLLAQIRRDGESTHLEILGPLGLFHTTTIYGRTLARLVPHLAEHARFALALHCDLGGQPTTLHVEPPVVLPRIVAPRPARARLAERLARELGTRGFAVHPEPAPLAAGDRLVFPELAIHDGSATWYLEVIGFATDAAVAAKLATYRAAGCEAVILCVDARQARASTIIDPRLVAYRREIDADAIERLVRRS